MQIVQNPSNIDLLNVVSLQAFQTFGLPLACELGEVGPTDLSRSGAVPLLHVELSSARLLRWMMLVGKAKTPGIAISDTAGLPKGASILIDDDGSIMFSYTERTSMGDNARYESTLITIEALKDAFHQAVVDWYKASLSGQKNHASTLVVTIASGCYLITDSTPGYSIIQSAYSAIDVDPTGLNFPEHVDTQLTQKGLATFAEVALEMDVNLRSSTPSLFGHDIFELLGNAQAWLIDNNVLFTCAVNINPPTDGNSTAEVVVGASFSWHDQFEQRKAEFTQANLLGAALNANGDILVIDTNGIERAITVLALTPSLAQ